jgi:hypothetical protein
MASMISSICRTARLVKRSFKKPAWPKEPLFRHPSPIPPGDLGVGLGQFGASLAGQADNQLVFSGKQLRAGVMAGFLSQFSLIFRAGAVVDLKNR